MQKEKNPCDPRRLIAALTKAGLNARLYEDEDGRTKAIVPVLDRTSEEPITDAQNPEIRAYLDGAADSWGEPAFLYLAAEEEAGGCQVGAVGRRGDDGKSYRSDDWERVSTVEEAVGAFQNMWEQRDSLINIFVGGA